MFVVPRLENPDTVSGPERGHMPGNKGGLKKVDNPKLLEDYLQGIMQNMGV